MKDLHSKLNWDEFQKIRTKRRKEKITRIWIFALLALATGIPIVFSISHDEHFDLVEPTYSIESRTSGIFNVEDSIRFSVPNDSEKTRAKEAPSLSGPLTEAILFSENSDAFNQVEKIVQRGKISGLEYGNYTVDSQVNYEVYTTESDETITPLKIATKEDINHVDWRSPGFDKSEKPNLNGNSKLTVSYIPYHSSRLVNTEYSEYRALNSFVTSITIPVFKLKPINASVSPMLMVHRYQMQYEAQYEGQKYMPGSIVGYHRIGPDILPIYGDSINGMFSRTIRKNGIFADIVVPLELQYTLVETQKTNLLTTLSTGLVYRPITRGKWSDNIDVYELESYQIWNGQFAFGLSANYKMKAVNYNLQYTGYYRNVNSESKPIFHQISTGVQILLNK